MTSDKRVNRRDQARQTRRKILKAAHEEFLERGYHGATIAAIARRAGVANQTVYFVFHTKSELVSAVIDDAVLGPDDPTIPQQSEWWASMLAAPSAPSALEYFIRGAAPLLERAAAVAEVVRAAAMTDEEVMAVHRYHDGMQVAGYGQVIDVVAAKGELRDGLTPQIATDVLLTLCGDALWVVLRKERGWPFDRVVDWLVATVPGSILAEPAALK
ncbi:TetR/AcrR family transcriptional regulator [Agromyces sp. SYSU K20354]|uniref:TetR/AcrR family transcriptional regulator n=1 Tax=Agromyces cavernae TaxID=2898659 RepID=UPI001E488CC6|nr:TetR/AcrR family transcriptional regulator [Agromyces cavernae]MCD2441828.1 TetR/AcrR family transcriptional regulator [Agromyces cavernae]